MRITPGAGKIAVKKLDLSQELPITRDDGTQVRLKVFASDNHEGVVAEVIATCKPWATAGAPEHVFNPEYDVGTIVIIGKWTGTRLNIDREEFIILREEDVLCTLDNRPQIATEVTQESENLDRDDAEADKVFDANLDETASQVR